MLPTGLAWRWFFDRKGLHGPQLTSSGCWLWAGRCDPDGYARTSPPWNYAHRRAWIQLNGPVSAGMVLHHVCYQRACVNPRHLELMPRGGHIAAHWSQRPRFLDRPLEERRRLNRERQQAWLTRRRLAKGCRYCLAPRLLNLTTCEVHREQQNAAKRGWRHRQASIST